jgi:hypothetical protein
MKRACLIAIFFLSLGTLVSGQDTPKDNCPQFYVQGPYGMVTGGGIAPFYVRWVDADGQPKTRYVWKVSAGEIIAGQGTQVIEVKTPNGGYFTVLVEIGGLPARCPNIASETTGGDPPPAAERLQEYTGPLTRITKSKSSGLFGI